VQERDF